jgi:hypothetical protein
MTNEGRAKEYFDLFEQYRGYRPTAEVHDDAGGTTHIKADGFAEVIISSHGGWDMPNVISYPEGTDYESLAKPGWPRGRGMARKIACIFADYHAHKRRGEKPPYFLLSQDDYLRDVTTRNKKAEKMGR